MTTTDVCSGSVEPIDSAGAKPKRLPKERRWRTAVKSEEDRAKKCLTDA
ncbi:hypothetical protein [Sutterella wadsworthensis]|nr:hypothetical protein [Sutterella wadsworthensis]